MTTELFIYLSSSLIYLGIIIILVIFNMLLQDEIERVKKQKGNNHSKINEDENF